MTLALGLVANGGLLGRLLMEDTGRVRKIFLGIWRKDDLHYIIVKSLVKPLPMITRKTKNVLNKLVHLAKIGSKNHLVLYSFIG